MEPDTEYHRTKVTRKEKDCEQTASKDLKSKNRGQKIKERKMTGRYILGGQEKKSARK